LGLDWHAGFPGRRLGRPDYRGGSRSCRRKSRGAPHCPPAFASGPAPDSRESETRLAFPFGLHGASRGRTCHWRRAAKLSYLGGSLMGLLRLWVIFRSRSGAGAMAAAEPVVAEGLAVEALARRNSCWSTQPRSASGSPMLRLLKRRSIRSSRPSPGRYEQPGRQQSQTRQSPVALIPSPTAAIPSLVFGGRLTGEASRRS
jgi:hypothetical protein